MEENQELQLFAQPPLSKESLVNTAYSIMNTSLEKHDPLWLAQKLAAINFLVEKIKKDPNFKKLTREACEKLGKGYKFSSGVKIELAELGTEYDYSKCNDSYLDQITEEFETLKEKIKSRQDFLKSLPLSGIEILDKGTGELITVYPPSKSSESGIKVTLPK